MSNSPFRIVFRFELLRTIRKPTFWIATLLVPALFGTIALVIAWSNTTSAATHATQNIHFEYNDSSGLISPTHAQQQGGSPATNNPIERVKNGTLDAYIDFPRDPVNQTVTIYALNRGPLGNNTYATIANTVFNNSINSAITPPTIASLVGAGINTSIHTFDNGIATPGLGAMIPPALLIVLLILVLTLFGNQMLNATMEEKKNRISEMLLTSLPARTLIRAKFAALSTLGLLQIVIVLSASLLIYLAAAPALQFGHIDLTQLQLDPLRMSIGILILLGSFLMIASLLVTIGAVTPSPAEAAPFFSIVVIATIAPLYLATTILTNPNSPVVQTLTFFPLSAPMTALLRNATATLDPTTGLFVAIELLIIGALILRFAVTVFERGVIHYDRRLTFREIITPNRAAQHDLLLSHHVNNSEPDPAPQQR